MVGECQVAKSRGIWKTQRIGPFTSFGGFDWWSIGWLDVIELSSQSWLSSIQAHWTGPVGSDSMILGFPPIHVHHVHVKPCDHAACSGLTRVIEHHGDMQFIDEGTDAFGLMYKGAGKQCSRLSVDMELNDARPRDSAILQWWFQISALVRNASEVSALSLFKFHGPVEHGLYHGHIAHMVPTNRDSFLWFAASWPHPGYLLNAVQHSHARAFQGTVLASGSPQGLGLDHLLPSRACCTVSEMSLGSSAQLLESIRALLAHKKAIICSAKPYFEIIDGEFYDRTKQHSTCKWRRLDSDMVVSAFWAYGPHHSVEFKKSRFPEHANWYLTYVADDGSSHYDTMLYALHVRQQPRQFSWVSTDVDFQGTHFTSRTLPAHLKTRATTSTYHCLICTATSAGCVGVLALVGITRPRRKSMV